MDNVVHAVWDIHWIFVEAIPQYTVPTEVTTKTSHPMPKTSPVLPGVRPIVEPGKYLKW